MELHWGGGGGGGWAARVELLPLLVLCGLAMSPRRASHVRTQTRLESLRDISLTLGSILDPYLPRSTLNGSY